jgi:hypothetical protein
MDIQHHFKRNSFLPRYVFGPGVKNQMAVAVYAYFRVLSFIVLSCVSFVVLVPYCGVVLAIKL